MFIKRDLNSVKYYPFFMKSRMLYQTRTATISKTGNFKIRNGGLTPYWQIRILLLNSTTACPRFARNFVNFAFLSNRLRFLHEILYVNLPI